MTTGVAQSSTIISTMADKITLLRVELDAANKKIQRCTDTIVSQAYELTMLRNIICQSCKHKILNASFDSSPPPGTLASRPTPPATSSAVHQTSSSVPEFPVHSHLTHEGLTPQSFTPDISMINLPRPLQASSKMPAVTLRAHRPIGKIIAISSSDTNTRSDNSDFPWSVTIGPDADKILDVTFERVFSHKERVNCVQFSLDGKYVAIGLSGRDFKDVLINGEVVVYSTETGKRACRLVEQNEEEKPGVRTLCFSPNSRLLAIGHFDGHMSLWLIANKRVRNVFGRNRVTDLDFSPNGQNIVSTSGDDTVRIWYTRRFIESIKRRKYYYYEWALVSLLIEDDTFARRLSTKLVVLHPKHHFLPLRVFVLNAGESRRYSYQTGPNWRWPSGEFDPFSSESTAPMKVDPRCRNGSGDEDSNFKLSCNKACWYQWHCCLTIHQSSNFLS